MNLSDEAFRENAEMYMQKMGHVDPLTLTVKDQEAYQKIVNTIYHDAMGLVMIVVIGLMVLGIILALTLSDLKKQKSEEKQ
jgi:adenine/guanine phosphoribosyltransferase-like PRPP-binding protein